MQLKMKELQVLMTKGGLNGAAEMLNDMMNELVKKSSAKSNIRMAENKGKNSVTNGQMNRNENATILNRRQQSDCRSVETIYEDAVCSKRNSSSSEDGLVNTSDEFDNTNGDNLKHIERLIAGGRKEAEQ